MEIDATTYQLIFHFITLITLIIQGYLFYLINKKCPKSMQSYKYFLNSYTFWDLIYTTTLGFIVIPDPMGRHSFSSRILGVSSLISPKFQMYSFSFIVYGGAGMLMCQAYCLFYRFTVILENPMYHRFLISDGSKLGCIFGAQILMIILGIFTYFTCVTPENYKSYVLNQPIEIREYFNPDEFLIWMDMDSKITQYFMLTLVFIFLISQILCIFIVYIILKILRQKVANFSKNTLRLHIQFTILLATQLTVPIVIIMLPVSICCIKTLVGDMPPKYAIQLGIILISCYGLINGILALIFIQPFREHFLQKLLKPVFSLMGLMSLVPKGNEVSVTSRSSRFYSKNTVNVTS